MAVVFRKFMKLEEAVDDELFDFDQAGGCTQLAPMYQSHDSGKYHHTANLKICILADRDTKGPADVLDENKKGLLELTCGKTVTTVSDSDIYSLYQSPVIWHIWFFREIENYFPEKQYVALGLDPRISKDNNPDWHYRDLCSIEGYDKNSLSKLTKGMTYEDYEDGLRIFQYPGGSLSEMQMFLLF